MADNLSYVLGASGLFLLWYWWIKLRKPSYDRSRLYLCLYDGKSYVLYDAERDAAGNLVSRGVTYSSATCERVQLETSLPAVVYMHAAEPIALATHRTLEAARKHIVMGSLFRSGGELVENLRLFAQAAVIACALYGLMQVSGLSSALARQEAALQKFDNILSKPLVVAPAEPAPVPTEAAP